LVSGLISPTGADLLCEKNTVGWLKQPASELADYLEASLNSVPNHPQPGFPPNMQPAPSSFLYSKLLISRSHLVQIKRLQNLEMLPK